MSKLKSLTKRYQEREEEYEGKYRNLAQCFEDFKVETKRNKEQQLE